MQISVTKGLSSIVENWDKTKLNQSPDGQTALSGIQVFEDSVRRFQPRHLVDSIRRRFAKDENDNFNGRHLRTAKLAAANISTPELIAQFEFALRTGRIPKYEKSSLLASINSGGGTLAGLLRNVEIDRRTLAEKEIAARKNPAMQHRVVDDLKLFAQIESTKELLIQVALYRTVRDLSKLGNSVIIPLFAKRKTPITNFDTQLACCECTSIAMHLAAHQALIKNAGDLVIFPSGTFDALIATPGAVGGKAVVIDSKDTDYKLDAQNLEKYLKTLNGAKVASIVITDPTNPSGKKYSQKELEALGKLAVEYGFKVIVDEHFAGLDLAEKPKRSADANSAFASLEVQVSGNTHRLFDHSFTIQGTTKITGNQSLTLGFGLSGDPELVGQVKEILRQKELDLTEYELMRCLDLVPERIERLEESLTYLRKRRRIFKDEITRLSKKDTSNPFRELSTPEYGFYSLVGIPRELAEKKGIMSSHALAEHLVQNHDVGARSVDGMFTDPASIAVRANFSDTKPESLRVLFQSFSDFT